MSFSFDNGVDPVLSNDDDDEEVSMVPTPSLSSLDDNAENCNEKSIHIKQFE